MQIDQSVRAILLLASDPWSRFPENEDTDFPQREADCNWALKFSASVNQAGIKVHLAILRDKARCAPAEIDHVLSAIEQQVGFSSSALRHEFSTEYEQAMWQIPIYCGVSTSKSNEFRLASLRLIEFIDSALEKASAGMPIA